MSIFVNTIDQLTLVECIKSGYFKRHISNQRKLYAKRLECLKSLVKKYFVDRALLHTNDSGHHLIVEIQGFKFTEIEINSLRKKNIIIDTAANHAVEPDKNDYSKLIIAFSNLSPENLERGMKEVRNLIMIK